MIICLVDRLFNERQSELFLAKSASGKQRIFQSAVSIARKIRLPLQLKTAHLFYSLLVFGVSGVAEN